MKWFYSLLALFVLSFVVCVKTANGANEPQRSGNSKQPGPFSRWRLASLFGYRGATTHGDTRNTRSRYSQEFNDPFWPDQWYAQDYRSGDTPVMDMNLVPVYRQGITGRGVTVAVVDSDFDPSHPDIQDNLLPGLSFHVGINRPGFGDLDPAKLYSHGLQCAGIIAMTANNSNCGVGVAFNAKVAGIVDSWSVPYTESRSLSVNSEHFDIYSNSWGHPDIVLYKTTDTAINTGLRKGRNRKGILFVFSTGNDREVEDNCALNPYLSHRGTIAITAAGRDGHATVYADRCAAVFATAYSGSSVKSIDAVVTTNVRSQCTTGFSGTSAAAPLAAGIFALVLEANPELRYRDVMHLVTMSAEVAPLADNPDTWQRNGAGFWVSNDFGFGLLNAENMVLLAQGWKGVPRERSCYFTVGLVNPEPLYVGKVRELEFTTDACEGTKDAITVLEQVHVTFTIKSSVRGAVTMNLTSPAGTETVLLEPRPRYVGRSSEDIPRTIRSVQNWGEDPRGTWKLEVLAMFVGSQNIIEGYLHSFTFALRGTTSAPPHHHLLPRTYATFRLPDGQTNWDIFRKRNRITRV